MGEEAVGYPGVLGSDQRDRRQDAGRPKRDVFQVADWSADYVQAPTE